ncbi:TerB family tellurite resistance protein [Zobellia roscoffensis]|uniref:TerB family tellurite resistance protein n=1 Tax=Zobellia roscoffensis TaxID=2779508 RepID=UPI00188C092F|nr:TerB family tellurite resistance protein [Zobellia roscoffensis]
MKIKKLRKVQFEEIEKKAIFVMTHEVILADGTIHPSEVEAMKDLQEGIGMGPDLIAEAKQTSVDEALVSLHNMTYSKKKVLAQILEEMAISDNHLHEKEMQLIIQTFKNIGIGGETE